MQNDTPQRAAKRERLLTLLHKTEGRLDDFIKRAKNDFGHAGLGPDLQILEQTAVYLRELGLTADAQRLINEQKEWVFALTDIGFANIARNMSAKEKAALKRKYGPFPSPSDRKGQQLRKVALIGQAVRLKKVINGLIHTCGRLSDLKADTPGARVGANRRIKKIAKWVVKAILVIAAIATILGTVWKACDRRFPREQPKAPTTYPAGTRIE